MTLWPRQPPALSVLGELTPGVIHGERTLKPAGSVRTQAPRRISSSRSCIRPSPTRRSFRAPRSSIDSMRRTCRSRLLPRRRVTARRRCWPNGRGVTLLASRGSRSTGTTMISGGWCRTPPPPSIGSTPSDPKCVRPNEGRQSVAAAASRVAAAMSGMKEPVVLVLDHVESLQNDECLDTIAELALHLPSRLAARARDARANHRFPWPGFAPALTS